MWDSLDKRIARHVMLWLVVGMVLYLIGYFIRTSGLQPNPVLYQVVLLKNDQAFYGKLHRVHSDYPYLTDVYYLKPQPQEVDRYGRSVGGEGKFQVIKRGGEIHGPTDTLYVAKDSITYWENVGADSLVAQGIKADKDLREKQKK